MNNLDKCVFEFCFFALFICWTIFLLFFNPFIHQPAPIPYTLILILQPSRPKILTSWPELPQTSYFPHPTPNCNLVSSFPISFSLTWSRPDSSSYPNQKPNLSSILKTSAFLCSEIHPTWNFLPNSLQLVTRLVENPKIIPFLDPIPSFPSIPSDPQIHPPWNPILPDLRIKFLPSSTCWNKRHSQPVSKPYFYFLQISVQSHWCGVEKICLLKYKMKQSIIYLVNYFWETATSTEYLQRKRTYLWYVYGIH